VPFRDDNALRIDERHVRSLAARWGPAEAYDQSTFGIVAEHLARD
jgi:hypothetical protein